MTQASFGAPGSDCFVLVARSDRPNYVEYELVDGPEAGGALVAVLESMSPASKRELWASLFGPLPQWLSEGQLIKQLVEEADVGGRLCLLRPPAPRKIQQAARLVSSPGAGAVIPPTAEEAKPLAARTSGTPDTDQPLIETIDFLEGDDLCALGAVQYVNLLRDGKWIDGDKITSIDRLGRYPRFKVAFNQPGTHRFHVVLEPSAGNVQYSGDEKKRNSDFNYLDTSKTYTTNGDGTLIVDDFYVEAAGGQRYRLRALDDYGGQAQSSELETRRRIFLVPIPMTGVAALTSFRDIKTEYANHGIDLVVLPKVEIPHQEVVDPTSFSSYKTALQNAFASSDGPMYAPLALAWGITDHVAEKISLPLTKTSVAITSSSQSVWLPSPQHPLWIDMQSGDDWFISGEWQYQDSAGTSHTDTIAKASVTPITMAQYFNNQGKPISDLPPGISPNACHGILVTNLAPGTGTIEVNVNAVDQFCGGLSLDGTNCICIAGREYWLPAAEQGLALVHEIGHHIDMVCNPATTGPANGPDAPAHYYDTADYPSWRHYGPHCKLNAVFDTVTSTFSTSGSCVMFGQTSSNMAFCADCAPCVKKLDLSQGFPT